MHNFLRGLLFFNVLELHNLNLSSILHVAIFITFCECIIRIRRHFNFWRACVKPHPQVDKMNVCDGTIFQIRLDLGNKKTDIKEYFGVYCEQVGEELAGHLVLHRQRDSKSARGHHDSFGAKGLLAEKPTTKVLLKISPLFDEIKRLKEEGVTVYTLLMKFPRRRIRPLRARYDYIPKYPS